jgi:folate-binding protein YgfZ
MTTTEPIISTTAGLDARPVMLRISGPEAASFLQGQITHDVGRLADGHSLLAACNTPQGRVIALLRLSGTAQEIHAVVAGDVAAELVAHLRRYVLRAKVRLELDERILAPADAGAAAVLAPRIQWSPGRSLVIADAEHPPFDETSWQLWRLADVVEGVPDVTAATSGHFVAQMLNLDRLDGISFTKGCYTGQEIVARTQNLGRIKRRMLRYAVPHGPAPSQLAALHAGDRKVGEVVLAAADGARCELLAVVQLDARDEPLRLEDGRTAEPRPLPYEV